MDRERGWDQRGREGSRAGEQRDRADRERAEREQRDRADREQRERAARDRGGRQWEQRDRADRDRVDREQRELAARDRERERAEAEGLRLRDLRGPRERPPPQAQPDRGVPPLREFDRHPADRHHPGEWEQGGPRPGGHPRHDVLERRDWQHEREGGLRHDNDRWVGGPFAPTGNAAPTGQLLPYFCSHPVAPCLPSSHLA